MTTNDNIHCVPCTGLQRDHLIPVDELKQRILEQNPLWTLYENKNSINEQGTKMYYSINRKFTTKNFQAAIDCITAIGTLAEELNHHPDLHITNYREVHIELYTHKLSGVTENDIVLAHRIDTKVQIDYSPRWLQQHPEALRFSKKT
jgi:4a-hydroxytetrahydrobiopterin dehydratase